MNTEQIADTAASGQSELTDGLGATEHRIKVSIDGLRRAATSSMNKLASEIEVIAEYLPDWKKEELFEAFDEAARDVDIFNCVYSDKIEMFSDLSEKIEVRRLSESA